MFKLSFASFLIILSSARFGLFGKNDPLYIVKNRKKNEIITSIEKHNFVLFTSISYNIDYLNNYGCDENYVPDNKIYKIYYRPIKIYDYNKEVFSYFDESMNLIKAGFIGLKLALKQIYKNYNKK